ncbi:MAG: ABC transporter substrate-binding protein [Gammaproteobacteria bacterium]|nr:ABC transporter substrate-binding protein [Gammaproteobacteria bacterium]
MTSITLLENLRAVFYAPFYLAHARGLFADEGVDVALEESASPLDTAARAIAGDVDVCWGGPLRVLKSYDEDPDVDLVCFGEVIGRDPFFLVGRPPAGPFSLGQLRGLRIGVVNEVPTPWICLQQDLIDAGIDPGSLEVVANRGMADNLAAALAGELDVFQAFQPYVEQAVQAGLEVLVASADRGPTAYTSFYTRRDKLPTRREAFRAMTRAMARSVAAVYTDDPMYTARTLEPYFPDHDVKLIAACIDRYRDRQIYNRTGELPRAGFERLRQSMLSTGFIRTGASYETCVDNTLMGP